jgi:hypothetical protein
VFPSDVIRLNEIVTRYSQMKFPGDLSCYNTSDTSPNCTDLALLDCYCDFNRTQTPTATPSFTPSASATTLPPIRNETTVPPLTTGLVIEVPTTGNLTSPIRVINDNLDLLLAIGIPMTILAVGLMSLALYKGLSS